jgi:hypothetical protein
MTETALVSTDFTLNLWQDSQPERAETDSQLRQPLRSSVGQLVCTGVEDEPPFA